MAAAKENGCGYLQKARFSAYKHITYLFSSHRAFAETRGKSREGFDMRRNNRMPSKAGASRGQPEPEPQHCYEQGGLCRDHADFQIAPRRPRVGGALLCLLPLVR